MGIININDNNHTANLTVQPNINKALQILQQNFHIHNAEIKEGLSNGTKYYYIRIGFWKQLPEDAYNAVKHLIHESVIEDDDCLPRYSYNPNSPFNIYEQY